MGSLGAKRSKFPQLAYHAPPCGAIFKHAWKDFRDPLRLLHVHKFQHIYVCLIGLEFSSILHYPRCMKRMIVTYQALDFSPDAAWGSDGEGGSGGRMEEGEYFVITAERTSSESLYQR